LSDYANTLAYAADAQRMVCNLESALSLRTKVHDLAQTAAQSDPGNNDLIRRHAYAISGIATLQVQLGQLEAAEENLEQSISLLQQLSAADPSNVEYRHMVVIHQVLLGGVIADNDELQEAQSLMQKLESDFDFGDESVQMDRARVTKYVEFQLAYADIEARLGNMDTAERHLRTALQLQLDFSSSQALERFDRVRFLATRFLWWQVTGQDINEQLSGLPAFELALTEENQSCAEAEVAARMFVMKGDFAGATRQVNYLRARHYADPAFERFCERYGL
jgi:tetratricopeptide (TPR) repeat protein